MDYLWSLFGRKRVVRAEPVDLLIPDVCRLICLLLDHRSLGRLCRVNRKFRRLIEEMSEYQQLKALYCHTWQIGNRLMDGARCGYFHVVKHEWTRDAQFLTPIITPYDRFYAFVKACRAGHLPIVEWIYAQLTPEILRLRFNATRGHPLLRMKTNRSILGEGLAQACKHNRRPVVDWLLKQTTIEQSNQTLLEMYCLQGSIREARDLLRNHSSLDLRANLDRPFRICCKRGRLEMAQWLLSICPSIDRRAKGDNAFHGSCQRGHLSVAQWLYPISDGPTTYPDCPGLDNNQIQINFQVACCHNHLAVAQWLQSLYSPELTNQLFTEVCGYNALTVAQWLYSLQPTLTFQGTGNYYQLAMDKHLQMFEWLLSIGQRPPVDWQLSGAIGRTSDSTVIAWLHAHFK